MRTGRFAHKITCRPLHLEHTITATAAHVVTDRPLSTRVVLVQPTHFFFCVHYSFVKADYLLRFRHAPRPDADRVYLQAIPPYPCPPLRGGHEQGWEPLFNVTTGRIAAAWTMLLPLPAGYLAPFGAGLNRLQIKHGVCRYRRHSGRVQGDRLTPLLVVPDGVSFLFAAGPPIRGTPTRKA